MLTEEQQKNGLNKTAYLWPNKEVPYVIDSVFSKYCGTRLQSGLRGVEEIISALGILF